MKQLTLILSVLILANTSFADNLPINAVNKEAANAYLNSLTLPTMQTFTNIPQDWIKDSSVIPNQVNFGADLPKTKMTVGTVAKQAVNLDWLPTPIFIVGDDAISKQWLTVHLQDLVRLHAQGILVNSKSKEAVAAMRSTFSTLSLLTVSANMIADNLHLNHYPVLITRHEVLA